MLLWRFSGLVSFPNSQLIHPDTTTMNIMKMMKQVQQMQAGLAAAQEKLASQTVTTEGAGGKLKVTATCDGNLTELVIDPSIINPSDSEFLQELLLQTINAAIAKGKETAAAEMKKRPEAWVSLPAWASNLSPQCIGSEDANIWQNLCQRYPESTTWE